MLTRPWPLFFDGLKTLTRRPMRNQLGFLLQFAALTFLPLLIIWQLNFKFELLWMPMLTAAAAFVFWVGHRLREPDQ